MKRTSLFIVVLVLVVPGAIGFAKCGSDHSSSAVNSTTDTSTMGPAPDNNSANNPSLADTAYEKNKTRPITDTMKQDTPKRR
jgi:hypothetical protein